MNATMVIMGTKLACNHDFNGDLIWMQYEFQRGLNMPAISNSKGPNMLAIIEIVLEARDYNFWTNHARKFSMFASIFGPYSKRLQAYMVRFGFEIASILSPL